MTRLIAALTAAVFTAAVSVLVASPAHAEPTTPFKNCSTAKKNGYCDIPQTSDLFTPSQDRDGDGIACEC